MKTEFGNLVLTLKLNEYVVIGDVKVTVTRTKPSGIRLLIQAPKGTKIDRFKSIEPEDIDDFE